MSRVSVVLDSRLYLEESNYIQVGVCTLGQGLDSAEILAIDDEFHIGAGL